MTTPLPFRFAAALLAPLALAAQSLPNKPAAAPTPAATDAVVLSPFEVSGNPNDSYEATNTNSLTGISTPLNKAPLDARVLTRTMMDELGGGDVFRLLSDYGGLGAMLFGGGNEDQRGMQEGDAAQPGAYNARGFSIGEPRRDGFLRSSTAGFNGFDVESAEAVNGSNNLLYGSGDPGGIVVINTKRARVNQRSATLSTKFDSEGSHTYTGDFNVGTRRFAVRLNLLENADRYYRPILGLDQTGLQAAATFRPWRWLSVFADFRRYERAAIIASGATLRTPTGLVLSNGVTMDNQSPAYITGFGGSALLNNLITLRNQDSLSGVVARQHWINQAKGVTVDLTPHRDFAFQFRYSHDDRINRALSPLSTQFLHPDLPTNLATDANGAPLRQWAAFTSLGGSPFSTGAHGYKFTAVGRRDLGRWGDHRLSVFYSRLDSWTVSRTARFYEINADGSWVRNEANIRNADSGRTLMPALWRPIFSTAMPGNLKWPQDIITHPNGKRYAWDTSVAPRTVPATPMNPEGLGGPVNALGQPTSTAFSNDDTTEKGWGTGFTSSFWQGRIDTLIGLRFENASTVRTTTTVARGPIDYASRTYGVVFDTPLRGLRGYLNLSRNAKINFATDRDVFNNLLPIGKGETKEAGLKLSLWDHRLSGNVTYYQTSGFNFAASLGGIRDDVDPNGINGRNGGAGYVFSRVSDGLSASLSARPLKPWQITFSWAQANGSERSDITLPVFYNDEFNTTTVGGQQVVAIRNSANNSLSPLMVPVDPAQPAGAMTALSVAMMKDRASPYFANLDPDSGAILNSQALGLRTTGVGTTKTGLPISAHQLGFVPPLPELIVRKSGEATSGYSENSFSMINRLQVSEGRFRGLVGGLATTYARNFRGYMYTDAADGNKRKLFYYPDKVQNNVFLVYRFKGFAKSQMTVQLNIDNVFDRQRVLALPRSTNGTIRYFQYQYSPRKTALTTSVTF
jgi:outer membrane receptor protein involved in Fe transport